MAKKCLKCGYERQASDISPDYECPGCGVIYAKVESARGPKHLHEVESMTVGEDPTEWGSIRWLSAITAFYIVAFMLKMGEPDKLWWWLIALVFFGWLYSPFLLLINFSMENKKDSSALRVVFVAMLFNSVSGLYLSYEAFVVSRTDAGGAMMFGVLPMYQLVISAIGIAVAKGQATRPGST
ncbi:MAG: hypothetical protein Q8R92_14495 [Deltaproteobacteria bacterium]|nr:hypothetical protein [Deltaproteobacteria bacterium]